MREYADIVLALYGDIFDDFSNFKGILINILLAIECKWPYPLKNEHLRHVTLTIAYL